MCSAAQSTQWPTLPADLRIPGLLKRLEGDEVKEVIMALDPNIEGEATTSYLTQLLRPVGVKVTPTCQRPAGGLRLGVCRRNHAGQGTGRSARGLSQRIIGAFALAAHPRPECAVADDARGLVASCQPDNEQSCRQYA